MTGPSGNRLSICPLRFRIASPSVPIDVGCASVNRKSWQAILNLSGQIDLPISPLDQYYLFNINHVQKYGNRCRHRCKHCADTIFICHWHHVILVKNLANIHYLNAIYPSATEGVTIIISYHMETHRNI